MDIPVEELRKPHRGGTVLGLGIASLVLSLLSCGCCQFFGLVGLGLGIPAWIMGLRDLRAMTRGEMDPTGQSTTQAGMVCGIAGVVLGVLSILTGIAMLAFHFAGADLFERLNR